MELEVTASHESKAYQIMFMNDGRENSSTVVLETLARLIAQVEMLNSSAR